MQIGQLILVRTNPATQFIAGLAQNAADTVNLVQPPAGQSAGDGFADPGLAGSPAARFRARGITIASVQNLAWEISLWGTSTFNASPTDPTLSYLLGRWAFAAADGLEIGGTGLYYYA